MEAGARRVVDPRHPSIGALTGADLLAAWQAHDLLRLRQLTHLRWQLLVRRAPPIALDHAGGW